MLKLLAAFGGIKLCTPFADAEILQECMPGVHALNEPCSDHIRTFPIQQKSSSPRVITVSSNSLER